MIGFCKSCEQERELAAYQKKRGGKFYFRKHCVRCWSIIREPYQFSYRNQNRDRLKQYDAAKYSENRVSLNESSRRYYRKLQSEVFAHYGNCCACCGENEQKFLTLDHKNNDGAAHRRSIGIGHIFYRWIIGNGFPDTIQLLCNNCNSGKHRNGGVCPHISLRAQQKYEPSNWIL